MYGPTMRRSERAAESAKCHTSGKIDLVRARAVAAEERERRQARGPAVRAVRDVDGADDVGGAVGVALVEDEAGDDGVAGVPVAAGEEQREQAAVAAVGRRAPEERADARWSACAVRESDQRANSGSTSAWRRVPLRPNMAMGARPAPQPPAPFDDDQP